MQFFGIMFSRDCPDPYYHHGFTSNIQLISIWGDMRIQYFINSLGFRDNASIRGIHGNEELIEFLFRRINI